MSYNDAVSDTRIQAAFLDLLKRTAPTSREIKALARQARDPGYWASLNPGRRHAPRHAALPASAYSHAVETMNDEGYFYVDSAFTAPAMRQMRTTIDRVRTAGWPAIFATVYEEFWSILRTPPVTRLLKGMMGPEYRLIPHLWCHYVAATPGAHGWSPHVDGVEKTRASIWIPFTDATLDNGCIYLIPESRLPAESAQQFRRKKRYTADETCNWLQGMKALPAPAGSILGWNFGIVHWGSVVGQGPNPRISAAYEFIATDATPTDSEQPLFDIQKGIPSFAQRLQMIVMALRAYRKFEPQMARFYNVAEELSSSTWPE